MCDRLNDISEKQHLIVCNPPYIKAKQDKASVHSQVAKFEPEVALYLEDDLYEDWFKDFFKDILNKLYQEGVFLMEGHEDHLDSLRDLAIEVGFKRSTVLFDLAGEKRFLKLTQRTD
jgi:release factor glutamine methyltransferase